MKRIGSGPIIAGVVAVLLGLVGVCATGRYDDAARARGSANQVKVDKQAESVRNRGTAVATNDVPTLAPPQNTLATTAGSSPQGTPLAGVIYVQVEVEGVIAEEH